MCDHKKKKVNKMNIGTNHNLIRVHLKQQSTSSPSNSMSVVHCVHFGHELQGDESTSVEGVLMVFTYFTGGCYAFCDSSKIGHQKHFIGLL